MAKPDTLGLIHDNLFRREDSLTPKQTELLQRYEAAFTVWLDKPWLSDKEIRDYLVRSFGISVSQAYIDIKNLQFLLGKVRNASKEWYRYVANELVKEAVNSLQAESEKGESENGYSFPDKERIMAASAKIKAAETLVKINRLDKNDADPFDWEQIKLPEFEPSNDPVAAGILTGTSRAELDEKIRKMEEKYAEVIEIKDIPYEPVERD